MIKIPGTQNVSRGGALKKALVGSAVVAALTCNPLHALAHLPFATIKNKIACFKNPYLNIATDMAVCLGTDNLLHSITDSHSHAAGDALGSGGKSSEIDLHHSDEFNHGHLDIQHIDPEVHEGGETNHIHNHNEHHELHDHEDTHNTGHGRGVALLSSLAEERKQTKQIISSGRKKLKTRFKGLF